MTEAGAGYSVEATAAVAGPTGRMNLGSIVAGPDSLMQSVDTDVQNYPHRLFRFVLP